VAVLSSPSGRRLIFLGLGVSVLILSRCAHQPEPTADDLAQDLPGFWTGLLHGYLILFNLVGSWITNVRIYAFPNAGRWYDFGYFLGVGSFLGSTTVPAAMETTRPSSSRRTTRSMDWPQEHDDHAGP
jgi:hypothetical protein